VLLLRAFRRHPGCHPPHRCAVTSSLAVGRPPGAIPGPLRLMGSARPPRGSSHLAAFGARGGATESLQTSRLPQAFTPLQSLTRRCPHRMNDAPLSRGFSPPQRHRSATSHPSRRCLLRVQLRPRRSSRPRRLAPAAISPVSPPGALSGFLPPGLDPSEIGTPLDVRLPSCDWRPHAFTGGASLQGFHPSDRLGSRVGISPSHDLPALLGFRLPGALPSAGLGSSLLRFAPVSLSGFERGRPPILLTCISGQSRFRVGSLCS
jgi:hypothetical protein